MKKIISFSLMCFLLSSPLTPVYAENVSYSNEILCIEEAIYVGETDNAEIGFAIFDKDVDTSDSKESRAYSSKSKTKEGYFYLKSNNDILGKFDCSATFSYDGSICNTTSDSSSQWEVTDGWIVTDSSKRNQISPTYACVTGNFELYKKTLFGKESQSSATINIYCTEKGVITAEFNGD
ncbi:MAG: hypothetical protein ACK5NF_03390 [Bacilli bacterium]